MDPKKKKKNEYNKTRFRLNILVNFNITKWLKFFDQILRNSHIPYIISYFTHISLYISARLIVYHDVFMLTKSQ